MPNPLFVANPSAGVAIHNQITFQKALTESTANLASDPTTGSFPARLSRWLSYNYTPSGGTFADRIAISDNYNPFNGFAYSIVLVDPDNTVAPAKPTRMFV